MSDPRSRDVLWAERCGDLATADELSAAMEEDAERDHPDALHEIPTDEAW